MTIPSKSGPDNISRLRKHADYQRVYRTGRRQSLPLMTYFFVARTEVTRVASRQDACLGSRVGLTTGRVLGNAVERNRIKRRMREAVRRNLGALTRPVDVVLHPRRSVLEADFSKIEREVARVFQAVQTALAEQTMRTHPPDELPGKESKRQDRDAG